ncbi:MAG TPA: heparinase II/III family protein [Thermoguttaceae bacterium]|nr:heparinase II/III family protein [Thermoguttaceae bacterium]
MSRVFPCLRCAVFAVLLVGLVASARSSAAPPKAPVAQSVPSPEKLMERLKPTHPRLLIDEQGFQELRRRVNTDRALKEWDDEVKREADKILEASLPRHVLPDGKRLLSTSRRVLGRTYTLALMYRLHGEDRYLDRLWQELQTVAQFPDFNPRHFLDTAEMTHALAIAYDWLYDTWTESQRATIRGAIVELGLKPGLEVYRDGGWWARSIHNWNQVCNGGMTAGALAVGDEEPELAGEILRGALVSLPLAMNSYAPDGAWGEGPGYWGYATQYNVVMLAALESGLGTDFGLSEMEGFADTGLFPMYMTGPTGRTFNFSDSGDRFGRAECLFWLGRRFDRPVYDWFALSRGKPSAAAMVWYRDSGQDPVAAGLPLDKHWRNVDAVTLRSHWTDPGAMFVGVQAGSNEVNHNHLDLGSFVLDGSGHRWAVDLGGDDYNLPGYFGSKRYTYYRLRAEGHNTLVVNPGDGPDQEPRATARISRFASAPEWAYAVADLTPAYAKHARRVERGVAMRDRRQVIVQDELDAEKPVDLWWFMHTPATVALETDGRVATLQQGDSKLRARIVTPADARFEVRPAEPLPSSPNPEGQRRNRDIRKLAVHLPQVRSLRLAVIFTPFDQEPEPVPASEVKPLAEW